ncbi:MAG: nucleotidyltransferase family protein [Candidatus Omnitrophota bacterium]
MNEQAVKKQFAPECALVLFIAREVTGNTEQGKLENLLRNPDINWPRFKALISYHELAPFAYLSLKRYAYNLAEEMREFLRQSYYYGLWRTEFFRQEFTRIADAFAQQGIDVVPIKGLGLVEDLYYQKPVRPMVDIDVLVREESLKVSERILQGLGYIKDLGGLKEEYWRQKQCHLSFNREAHRKSLLVELHWALDFKRDNQKILPLLWDRLRTSSRREKNIKLLSPEDTLFSLALHNRRFGKMFCLKYVCDIGLLLNKYKNELDWDYISQELRRGKMRATMFFALSQLKLLDFPLPWAILRDLNVPSWKGKLVRYFIERKAFSPEEDLKKTYLASHFLLYDNIWEPVKYILNIPQEQFAKYYGLAPYTVKTAFFYYLRWLYIPLKGLVTLMKKPFERINSRRPCSCYHREGEEVPLLVITSPEVSERSNLNETGDSSGVFFFQTSGFSMWPFLRPGTKLVVKRIPVKELRVGDIILYRQDGQTVCHRLVKTADAKGPALYARGDNSASPAEYVREGLILGKAIGMIKKGRICRLTGTRRHLINRGIIGCAPWISRTVSILKKFHIGQVKMI